MMQTLTVSLMVLIGSMAFAAQSVQKDLGSSGNWKAAQIRNHDLWQKDACVAYTAASGDASTLEVYAEKQTGGSGYIEPTVLVVTRKAPSFIRGILTFDDAAKTQAELTLASTAAATPAFGLMARIDDRPALLAMLKSAGVVKLQLVNEKNKVVKNLTFSLSGSSKTIGYAMSGCGLANPSGPGQ